jgi:hypothetical protein
MTVFRIEPGGGITEVTPVAAVAHYDGKASTFHPDLYDNRHTYVEIVALSETRWALHVEDGGPMGGGLWDEVEGDENLWKCIRHYLVDREGDTIIHRHASAITDRRAAEHQKGWVVVADGDHECPRCGASTQATHHRECEARDGTPLHPEMDDETWRGTFLPRDEGGKP